MLAETKDKTKIVHFSVEGEFLTNFARGLFIEDTPKKAVNFLKESIIGFPEDLTIDVVTGKKKLTGLNDLFVKKDNVKQMHTIPLSFESAWSRLTMKYIRCVEMLQMIKRRINILGKTEAVAGALYRDVNKKYNDTGYYDRMSGYTVTLIGDAKKYKALKKEFDAISAELVFTGL